MSADTNLMPIPGPVDPVPVPRAAPVRADGRVELIGRREHDEVAELLPRAEALVMPSTFPEAFGMVAVEAAACGTLPISAGHSGMLEVSRQLAPELPAGVGPLTSFAVEEGAVGGFGSHVAQLLADEGVFDRGLRFRSLTLPDAFIDQASPREMYAQAGLNAEDIERRALDALGVGVLRGRA